MEVVDDIRLQIAGGAPRRPGAVLTIGSFDGVHRGHELILGEVIDEARATGGTAMALTMRPHPREFFSPEHAPNLITSFEKKRRLICALGIDVLGVLRFDNDVASMSAREFVEQILCAFCEIRTVVVGHDFHFGCQAEGDYEFLEALGDEFGFEVRQIPPLFIHGERVSSTLVRERILQGDLEETQLFLGRRYAIAGEVIPGRGIGAGLGFPTANIKPHHNAVPPHGVYVAEARVKGLRYGAAVNIGIAPTICHEDVTIEAFLLDFEGDIVHEEVEVEFIERLRPERRFPDTEALVAQIRKDVETIRGRFRSNN